MPLGAFKAALMGTAGVVYRRCSSVKYDNYNK